MTVHSVAPDLEAGHPKPLSGSPNRCLVLIAMTGALSMIMLDQTVVSVALPPMSRELPLSSTGQQWVVNAYVLAMASLVALGGKLGDRFGGVRTFRFGVVIFFLASMGCGLAPHGPLGEPWLIAARVLQGAGAALMMPAAAAIATTVLAVQQANAWSWTSPATLLTLAAGLLISTWFVVTQLRSKAPLVQVGLFARREFAGNVAVLGLVQFGALAAVLSGSLYLQDLLRLSPIQAGLGVLPLILPIAAVAQLGGRWYDKAGVRPPVLTGLAIAVVGLAAWAAALPQLGYLLQVPGMIITGFGLGLVVSSTNTDALGRVDAEERSQASGLVQTVRQLGGTFGVAVIGAVVLGIEGAGTAAGSAQNAADAITAGFAVAAAAFAVALLVGWRLLSATRLTESNPARDSAGDVAVGS